MHGSVLRFGPKSLIFAMLKIGTRFTPGAIHLKKQKNLTNDMTKSLTILLIAIIAAAAPMHADNKHHAVKSSHSTSSKHVDNADATYASISKTNPFEIVPAAGMELLGDFDDSETAAMASDMISFAKKFIGTRYVRGGKTPKGFDCSGFTSYVFSQFGYSLSASSLAQYGQGEKLSRDEVSAGDLLFFTGRNSRSGNVGHVGIAISADPVSGDITFIHAAIGGGIRIDKTSTPYYAARYIGARRVLK